MIKRMLPFLALALVVCLLPAGDAEASCWRCSTGQQACVYVNHPGWYNCVWNPAEWWCDMWDECEPYGSPSTTAPLAADYAVASVERLDDETAKEDETQVARLDTAAKTTID